MKIHLLPRLGLLLVAGAASAEAAILAQYNFESSSLAANQTDASVNASDIQRYACTTPGNSGLVISGSGSPEGSGNLAIQFSNINDVSAPTDGTATPDNIIFTITSTSAQPVDLGELTFYTKLNTNNNAGAPGGFYTIQYDDLSDIAGFQLISTFNQTDSAVVLRQLDLSGSQFDNLTAGITFRIEFTEPAGAAVINSTNNSMKIDLITVYDMIPEPGSAALFLAGGCLMFVRKRKR